jgi:hypothetical protein
MEAFISRHEHLTILLDHPIALYSSHEDTKNGYACITPAGCFLDDGENKHRYSRPILSVGVKEAWTDIDYRPENFRSRGGYYQWEAETGGGMGAAAVATCGEKDIEDLCQSNRGSSSKKTHSSSLTKTSRHGPSSSHQASCPRANLSTPMNTSLCISVAAMAMMLFGTYFTSLSAVEGPSREW